MLCSIGAKLLDMYSDLKYENEYHSFLEFVCRRISTCNTGKKKYASEHYCKLLLDNVKLNLRPPILETHEYTEDLKCVLDKPFKTKYFEEDLVKFEKGDPKSIYKALHSVYSDKTFNLFFTRAHKLATIDRTALEKGYMLDFNERLVLLCNCIHNFHIILTKFKNSVSFSKGSRIFKNSILDIDAYDYAISNYVELILHPSNPSTSLITDFKERFYELFLGCHKELQRH